MRYGKFILLGSLALAALLMTTSSEANARVYGRGYGGGYGRGVGVGVGFGRGYGGYGYNRGYGGYGYRGVGIGIGLGLGLGGYGRGYGNGYYGSSYYSPSYYNSGYAYSPSYGSYSYVPNYSYAPSPGYDSNQVYPSAPAAVTGYAQSPDYSIQANPSTPSATTQQSLYYSPPQTDNSAQIRVLVPAGAQVWVGGELTSQTGSERVFSSPVIQPGRTYTYEVKARWMQEGEPVEQVKQVRVQANQTTTVDFSPLVEKQ